MHRKATDVVGLRFDPNAKLGPNVSIGPNVVVGKDTHIRNSNILHNMDTKQNTRILHAIIAGTRSTAMTKNGFKIQSVTILGKKVSVKDETIIHNCIVLPHKELKTSCENEIVM
ncbi:Proteasome subunit alpha type-2 [Podila clonocystis]|nr:Proteasome subunit alpha type-2 [Podila clonocystis]